MDAVLGVSMTGSNVGLVLVEGPDGDGATLAHNTIDLGPDDARDVCEEVFATVVQLAGAAAGNGHELRSIGVTWSDYAEREASQVVKSLSESGFGRAAPVRMPHATEALARGIADGIGFDTTVVCVIEPEMVIALTARPGGGRVRSAVNHLIDGDDALSGWLGEVFAAADRRPDALVVAGSAGDLTLVMPKLERALGVPVFTPAEAELALARGAALASARRGRFMVTDGGAAARRKRWTAATFAPVAMLAGGAATFVVSTSLAISMQLTPHQEPVAPNTRPAVNVTGASMAVPAPAPAAIPPSPPAQLAESEPVEAPVEQPPTPEFTAEPSVDEAPAVVSAPEEAPGLPDAPPDVPPPAEVPLAPFAQQDPADAPAPDQPPAPAPDESPPPGS